MVLDHVLSQPQRLPATKVKPGAQLLHICFCLSISPQNSKNALERKDTFMIPPAFVFCPPAFTHPDAVAVCPEGQQTPSTGSPDKQEVQSPSAALNYAHWLLTGEQRPWELMKCLFGQVMQGKEGLAPLQGIQLPALI